MAGSFQDMLKLIRDLTRTLEDLTNTQKAVAAAVRHEVDGMMTNLGFDPVQTKEQTASVSGAHTDFHA